MVTIAKPKPRLKPIILSPEEQNEGQFNFEH